MMMTAVDTAINFVSVKKQKDVLVQVNSFIDEIEKDLTKSLTGNAYIAGQGDLIALAASDFRHILQSKNVKGVELCIRNIILESIVGLERKLGMAGLIAGLTCVRFIKNQTYKHYLGAATERPDIEDSLSMLSRMSRCTSLNTIGETMGTYLSDPLVTSMVMQAYQLAGHSGQIFVDKEFAAATCIELLNGYTFPYGICPEFVGATKIKIWKETGVKCLIIDGVIERVSEIHHILQYFFEERWPGIIVTRGFGEEVLGTLISNYNRQTLNILPILVPYDLEGVNALVDIAVTCNTDVISSIKGELISSIDPTEIVTVEKITLSSKLIISNPIAEHNVRYHLSQILEQKKSAIQSKKELLDKRTKSLSSVCTHLKIDSHQKNRELCFNRIDHGIKLFKEMAAYGVIHLENISEQSQNKSIQEVIQLFFDSGYQCLPAQSLILGCKVGEEIANSILSSTTYLVLD
jgi:hypothetical protein